MIARLEQRQDDGSWATIDIEVDASDWCDWSAPNGLELADVGRGTFRYVITTDEGDVIRTSDEATV